MTKKELEDYRYKRLELLRYQQGKENVHDTVIGSSAEFPYTSHPVSIYGVPQEEQELVEELERKCKEVEKYIASLPKSYHRLLVKYWVIDGLQWKQIGEILGKNENTVKKIYSNLMKGLK